MKKTLRSIQVYLPFLQDLKYKLRFGIMNSAKRVHEDDFKLMKWFSPQANQVFVDIGSNRGEAITSMLIMSKLGTKVIGFEPNFATYKRLENYISGNKNVVIHNIGLGNKNEELKLYVPFYRKWMFDGLASFKYENAKDWLRTRMWFYKEEFLSIEESICKIRRLDEFNFNPYFIKIDVQGLELEVLEGGAETLKKNMPILLIESLSKECVEYLSTFGYEFYHFSKGILYEGTGQLNTYCIKMEKHPELKKCLATSN